MNKQRRISWHRVVKVVDPFLYLDFEFLIRPVGESTRQICFVYSEIKADKGILVLASGLGLLTKYFPILKPFVGASSLVIIGSESALSPGIIAFEIEVK